MYRVEFVEPAFREPSDELVAASLKIRDGYVVDGENPYVIAGHEIEKAAGLYGVNGAYGEVLVETVQETGYPIADRRKFPDGIPDTAKWHTDYKNDRTARPTAFYSPLGSRSTEFAVASCVSFKRRWSEFKGDALRRIEELSNGSDSRPPVLPINWFEIAIDLSEGSDADYDALDRFGIEVKEGRIMTIPPDHVAIGDGRTLVHKTPRYDVSPIGEEQSPVGKKRVLIVARPTFV